MKKDNKPKYIFIHHTAGNFNETFKSVRNFHIKEKEWLDIGYHYLIVHPKVTKGCLQKSGRPEWFHGAHTPGYNYKSIGICLTGALHKYKPHKRQLSCLGNLLKSLTARYGIPKKNVKGHLNVYPTLCPGKYLYEWLVEWKKRK